MMGLSAGQPGDYHEPGEIVNRIFEISDNRFIFRDLAANPLPKNPWGDLHFRRISACAGQIGSYVYSYDSHKLRVKILLDFQSDREYPCRRFGPTMAPNEPRGGQRRQHMKLTVALKRFFGLKEGQTLPQFAMEVKALTPEDKKELAVELTKEYGEEVEI